MATRFRPGQARWVSARTGETPLRESGKAVEREVFPAVEDVLCVEQGLAAGLDGDDFPEGSHRAAAVPGAVASREGSLERMRRHLRWTDVAVTGFRRARPARILQRRALGPGFCRTKPCGRHGRFPVLLRNFKAGLRSRAMDTEASGAPAVICGTAEFPETRVEMPAPMGRAASARPASAADLRRCAVTAAAQDQGHGHMIDRGVCPEGREGASARSDGQAPHRPGRSEPKGPRHCAAGSPAGTGPFPGQDQDRLIVWMKHENSSPCEPIRSLA